MKVFEILDPTKMFGGFNLSGNGTDVADAVSKTIGNPLDMFKPGNKDASDTAPSNKVVVVGDSLAVGTGGQIPGAIVDAKVGINSSAVLDRANGNKELKGADVAIISAGANDGAGASGKNPSSEKTIANLKAIRVALGAKKYVWILPYNRSVAQDIMSVAGNDEVIDLAKTTTPSKDGVHPSSYSPVAKDAIKKGGVSSATTPSKQPATTPSKQPGNKKIPSTGGKPSAGVAATGNAKDAVKFFMSKGWTKEQAAGIVGNLQAESGANLRTNAVGDGGQAYGLAQWHPDRQAKFKRAFGKDIRSAGFQEQLAFVQWEFEHDERRAAAEIRKAKTAKAAAAAMDQYYERSSGAHRAVRIANANNLATSTVT